MRPSVLPRKKQLKRVAQILVLLVTEHLISGENLDTVYLPKIIPKINFTAAKYSLFT